ncbi:MAG TPA: anti-sigma factor [Rhizobiaceae bacterium]|nr:anti-sigma factor [Rhizobiaceae bacterium]
MAETFSDEILMRFADGELDEATAARLEQALAADDALMARFALFTETRAASKAALQPLLDEPVPEKLRAAVEDMVARKKAADAAANVVAFPAGGASRHVTWRLPLAASLVAALVGAAAGFWIAGPSGTPSGAGVQIAGLNDSAISGALASVASGDETSIGADRFRAIATFRDSDQSICREFEIDTKDRDTVIAVACHVDRAWKVNFAVVAPSADGGYAPASSTEALEAYLAAIDAAEPMAPDAETEALRALPK